jgi:hypothetical protein
MPKEKHYTADGVEIIDGLAVWDYNLRFGRVSFARTFGVESDDFDGWYAVVEPGRTHGDRFNGERMVTRHPFDRRSAEDACLAGEAAYRRMTGGTEVDEIERQAHAGISLLVECESDESAILYAMKRLRPAVLRMMADLLHIEFDTDSPRKLTVARAVVREARA